MLVPLEPKVRVEVADCVHAAPGGWRVTWRIHNEGPRPIALEAAWVPHGRFRGEGRVPLARRLEPGQATAVDLTVQSHEVPGTVVENAFLILRTWKWRIFVRMRVEFDDASKPGPMVELVTVQRLR